MSKTKGAAQRTIKGKVVTEYLQRFPKTATKTLARKIYKDNPELFSSLDSVRTSIRYYRGALGSQKRGEVLTKEHFRVTDSFNPFDLPEPEERGLVEPFELPKSCQNVLILSDIHIPFHDNQAITTALEYGQSQPLDSIILNGDIFDFYDLSRFIKDPRIRDLPREVKEGKKFLQILRKTFPNCRIFFKLGNHEERWANYLFTKAPEVVGVEEFEFEVIYKFHELEITKVDGRSEIYVGPHFTILHGHEFQNSAYSPVNPARGLYLRYENNAIMGHFHRPSHHTQKTGRGATKSTWSLGCLCGLKPRYAPQNKWIQGFAHLVREGETDFHLKNYMIIDGRLYES